jgi:hypothetical protein
VAERIMRGYDWTRGPVIAGGLSGAEAADDLARMGVSVLSEVYGAFPLTAPIATAPTAPTNRLSTSITAPLRHGRSTANGIRR